MDRDLIAVLKRIERRLEAIHRELRQRAPRETSAAPRAPKGATLKVPRHL